MDFSSFSDWGKENRKTRTHKLSYLKKFFTQNVGVLDKNVIEVWLALIMFWIGWFRLMVRLDWFSYAHFLGFANSDSSQPRVNDFCV